MKKTFVKKQELKLGFTFKILLGSLVLAAVVGLCNAAQAAKGDANRLTDTLLFNQTSFFDPFELKTIRLTAESSPVPSKVPFIAAQDRLFLTTESSPGPGPAILGGIYRPPIRIPFRPVLRSPYRPLWP
jgi:hypothetical protein